MTETDHATARASRLIKCHCVCALSSLSASQRNKETTLPLKLIQIIIFL
jgi:hypothetical protein